MAVDLTERLHRYGEVFERAVDASEASPGRAGDVPQRPGYGRWSPRRDSRRSARLTAIAYLAVVVTVTLAATGLWVLLRNDGAGPGQSAVRVPTRVGTHIPLRVAQTPDDIFGRTFYASGSYVRDENIRPVSFDTGLAAIASIVTVTDTSTGQLADCLTVLQQTYGPSLACAAKEKDVFFLETPSDPKSPNDRTVYYAWTAVPNGTAYVAFRSPSLTAWQRPIHHTVVIPTPDASQGATLVAYNQSGKRLGNAVTFSSTTGASATTPLPSITPGSGSLSATGQRDQQGCTFDLSLVGAVPGETIYFNSYSPTRTVNLGIPHTVSSSGDVHASYYMETSNTPYGRYRIEAKGNRGTDAITDVETSAATCISPPSGPSS
jgi:hypothetical protein